MQGSEPGSVRHTGFGKDKPETASDFAVPDIKPSFKQQMNTTFNTQLFSVRQQQPSPPTTLPVPVFSNLQQMKN